MKIFQKSPLIKNDPSYFSQSNDSHVEVKQVLWKTGLFHIFYSS